MTFSNQTVYDKKRLLSFNTFVALRKRLFWAIMIIATILVSATFVFYEVTKTNEQDNTILACFAIIVVVDLTYVFCTFVLPHFTIKKSPAYDSSISYEFWEDSIKVSVSNPRIKENSEILYSSLVKVMENKQNIFLYISSNQSYILDKSGFTVGDSKELIAFLISKGVPYKR